MQSLAHSLCRAATPRLIGRDAPTLLQSARGQLFDTLLAHAGTPASHSRMRTPPMSLWIKLVLGAAAVYGVVVLVAYLGQRQLMYYPDRSRIEPAKAGLRAVQERVLKTSDGERIIAWY